jgi:hypothetical protein
MRALATYVLKGPWQAILVTVVFTLVSVVLPFVSTLSGAVVALVTLQIGPRQGILVTAGATVVAAVLAQLLPLPAVAGVLIAAAMALTLWLPVWLLAGALRGTGSLKLTMEAAALLGVVVVLSVFVLTGDPAQAWVHMIDRLHDAVAKSTQFASAARVYEELKHEAAYLTGSVTALMMMSLMVTVLIARAAQAMLYNPGGLRDEFNALRFDRVAAIMTLVLIAAAFATRAEVLANVAIVLFMMYMFYGLAVIHGALARSGASIGWLIGLYVVMMFAMAQVVLVLAVLGLLDTWIDFRARVRDRRA